MSESTTNNLAAALRWTLAISLAALPFELVAGLRIGGFMLSSVELLLLGTLGIWGLLLRAERRWPMVPAWLGLAASMFVAVLLLSALLAVEQRAGALKFALRQAQGVLLALCVADTVRRGAQQNRQRRPNSGVSSWWFEAPPQSLVVGGLLVGASMSALLGLLEMTEWPAMLALLAPFKTDSTYVGGLLRLSATFSYANTAAMYFEAMLPMALLVALLTTRQPTIAGWARGAATYLLPGVLLLATLLTYSRAALLTSGLLLLATPLVAWRVWNHRTGRRAAAWCGGLAGLGLLLTLASPSFRLRIIEPDVSRWYGAGYQPTMIATMAPNELRRVPIELENSGQIAWEPTGLRPVRLAYHWLDAATRKVVRYEGRRTELPLRVAPGERVMLGAIVQAPEQPGRYLLAWDMLREYIGRGWFSQMGIAMAEMPVDVMGAPAPRTPPSGVDPATSPRQIVFVPPPPGRRALWTTALALWSERPLLGIGPDRFRHVYGPRLGLAPFDDRVHTNNLYIELLVGAGIFGLGAFLALLAGVGWALWPIVSGNLRESVDGQGRFSPRMVQAGALLGIVAFLTHGMLDVFLAFTPTYALFWVLIGVAAGLGRLRAPLLVAPARTGV